MGRPRLLRDRYCEERARACRKQEEKTETRFHKAKSHSSNHIRKQFKSWRGRKSNNVVTISFVGYVP